MRTHLPTLVFGALCAASPALQASDLSLSVQVAGQNTVSALPGEVLTYVVVGELSDNLNGGLALYVRGLAETIPAGVDAARRVLSSGAGLAQLERFVEATRRLASQAA